MTLIPEPAGPTIPLTKIIATVGPATQTVDMIEKLVLAGASVFRLNFSHGSPDEHAAAVERIRAVGRSTGRPLAVLGDLQGPKLRVGPIAGGAIEVAFGQTIVIQVDPVDKHGADEIHLSCPCPALIDEVEPGQRLLINDGAVRTLVTDRTADALRCIVTHGGPILTGKGINVPDTELSINVITERDRAFVAWAAEHGVDLLALSFVREADDIRRLRTLITEAGPGGAAAPHVPIIAKIERPGAVRRIESIVDAADAIMIARGDLGVEMDLAELPVVQHDLISVAQRYGKPCIVATQMLESMIENATPTRAEANDVANAIFNCVDAVMLSGETAVGRFPSLAVDHMRRIAVHTEAHLAKSAPRPNPPGRLVETRYHTAALAHGVLVIARDIDARAIVVWSQSGGGARYLSQNRAPLPILAVTSDERTARQMQLLRGVTPLVMDVPGGLSAFTNTVDAHMQATGFASAGDNCVIVAGAPLGETGVTNSLAIHVVGSARAGFAGSK